jgi:hypothetical protein
VPKREHSGVVARVLAAAAIIMAEMKWAICSNDRMIADEITSMHKAAVWQTNAYLEDQSAGIKFRCN